jgi:hypothetical protein
MAIDLNHYQFQGVRYDLEDVVRVVNIMLAERKLPFSVEDDEDVDALLQTIVKTQVDMYAELVQRLNTIRFGRKYG